jgi:pimeloyl-ACP methyl ester carboxylesterase
MSSSARYSAPCAAILTVLAVSAISAAEKTASGTFDADGVAIFYQVAGAGTPVILIHGLAASGDLNWKWPGVMGELAKSFRVIALDLPGHGRSDKPARADAYGKQVVEDVVLLMDHLEIEEAHIVGYSAGGMIAMRLMANHPDRVISGTIGGMGWLQKGSLLDTIWGGLGGDPAKGKAAGFIHGIPEFALTKDELEAIRLPVKVIVGEQDPCYGLYVAPLRKVRPDWPVLEIKQAGHIDCVIQPEFRKAIAQWLKQNEPEQDANAE